MTETASTILTILFHHDHGVARAELHLTTLEDQIGRMVQVTSNGEIHTVTEDDFHRNHRTPTLALEAGLRRLCGRLLPDWHQFAGKHGTGAE